MTTKDVPLHTTNFPNTRYMGSKSKLLSIIAHIVKELDPKTALDAFAGSGCVGYLFKDLGIQVDSNDFLRFSYHIANASVANSTEILSSADIEMLLEINLDAKSFVQDTFSGLYYDDVDNKFLDNLWPNIQKLGSEYKKSLAYAAISRACIKRRPRGMFAYTGFRYDDGRNDLRMTLEEHFIRAVGEWNGAVFDNDKNCAAFNTDVFALENKDYDLVYIDPPYVSLRSDNDYTRRYHFIEGYMSYWQGVEIQENTLTKKIKSRVTLFGSRNTIYKAFTDLVEKYPKSTLLISYSSNSIPTKEEMEELLKKYRSDVKIIEVDYRYSFGTHGHKVGDNKNSVSEYLFIAK